MRIAVILVVVVATALSPAPVAAAEYDSAWARQSAFLSLSPGDTETLTVFFRNAGSVSWVKGTETQVDLAACLADKVTCDIQDLSEAPFDPGTWLSARRYATQAQSTVVPGAVGAFTYGIKVPAGQAAGTYRFNGDLVVAATGRRIHPEGYYHDVRVQPPTCTATGITASPAFEQVQVGVTTDLRVTVRCPDGTTGAANVPVTVAASVSGAGNQSFVRSVTTDASGVAVVSWTRSNPDTDQVTVSVAASPMVRATAVVRWTVAARVLSCAATDQQSLTNGLSRVFTVTLRDPDTSAPVVGATLDLAVTGYISLGTATINGTTAIGKLPGYTVTSATTDSGGVATLSVSGVDATISPRVFLDDDNSNILGTTEFRADCGSTTFVRP